MPFNQYATGFLFMWCIYADFLTGTSNQSC